jgi:NADH-quinone oxidoreductase subunit C
MSQKVLDNLQKKFGDAILETHGDFGDETAVVDPTRWKEIALHLRNHAQLAFDHFIDLTAVDWLGRKTPRFEVVLHLRSNDKLHRIRLKAPLDEERLEIESLVEVWKGANWFERECYDMFGVRFTGHPDLRRILMYEEFEGYPLRKDYRAADAQPLVPYRKDAENEKLPPFDEHEGMPFGRQVHERGAVDAGAPRPNVLGFEDD